MTLTLVLECLTGAVGESLMHQPVALPTADDSPLPSPQETQYAPSSD